MLVPLAPTPGGQGACPNSFGRTVAPLAPFAPTLGSGVAIYFDGFCSSVSLPEFGMVCKSHKV